jgi:phytoene dehydrogenase-like protein
LTQAIVVGSGPNGLACAVELARAGVEVTVLEAADTIGGGTRSADLTSDGLIHDVCSATHPMAAESPFLTTLGLERHGLEWCYPELDLVHPLDGGSAAVMQRDINATAEGLGSDGPAWKRIFGSSSAHFKALNEDMFRPILRFPSHPIRLARFGIPAATPATVLAKAWKTDEARALFGGVAAHAFSKLNLPMSSSVGSALIDACHAYGWPVAKGGSQSIANALAGALAEHGGRIETGRRVTSLADLPAADAVVFDTNPAAVAEIAGDRLPARTARAYRRYKHGPAAFKVDFAVEGGIPWENEAARRAGNVHVAGTFEEIAAAERDVNSGRVPERPFILVGQQYLADPSRSQGDRHPVWSYAHVPNGYTGDLTESMIAHIERFAPGFRERIVARHVTTPAEFEARNSNYAGGDIITGANSPRQILFRPRFATDPYVAGPGLYICSAATPPGAGAHGMCGYNAAQSVLKRL